MLDRIDKAGGTIEADNLVAADKASEQLIEAREMIHVPVADEDIAYAKELTRRQRREVAEVEEQGTVLEDEIDVEARIIEWIINEMRVKVPWHGYS
jgi:hypothetical protein